MALLRCVLRPALCIVDPKTKRLRRRPRAARPVACPPDGPAGLHCSDERDSNILTIVTIEIRKGGPADGAVPPALAGGVADEQPALPLTRQRHDRHHANGADDEHAQERLLSKFAIQ